MARGRDQHQARLAAVAALGRSLSRRAHSRCELCEGEGDLRPHEVGPVFEEPDPERAILACARCRGLLELKRIERDEGELRFLEQSVWSETLPAQLLAIRITRRLAEAELSWAVDCLDGLWLPDEVSELL